MVLTSMPPKIISIILNPKSSFWMLFIAMIIYDILDDYVSALIFKILFLILGVYIVLSGIYRCKYYKYSILKICLVVLGIVCAIALLTSLLFGFFKNLPVYDPEFASTLISVGLMFPIMLEYFIKQYTEEVQDKAYKQGSIDKG